MMPSPKPDHFEIIVRFVCGALAGGLVGVCAAVGTHWGSRELVGIVAGAALVFGACAAVFGDRFWRLLLRGWSGW